MPPAEPAAISRPTIASPLSEGGVRVELSRRGLCQTTLGTHKHFLKEKGQDKERDRERDRTDTGEAQPTSCEMDNGMAAGGGRGEREERKKEPAMIPFLSACFTELRAKGVRVCVC